MRVRRFLVSLITLLLAVTVVRNSAVDVLADLDPIRASAIWADHPRTEISLSMAEIARAARVRQTASADTFRRLDDAARRAPLAPEPYLVEGVQAQIAGRRLAAEQAFLAAEWRDPRSLPAHYFLAEQFFRARDAERGLREVAALANLAPGGAGSSAPYIAAFARDRANWPKVRAVFQDNPAIEDAALVELAKDGANAPALLALASPGQRKADSRWLAVLLASLVKDGHYSQARALWASASGIRPDSLPLLFDPDFTRPKPLPPFNWTLSSSTVGLAERQPGGRLHAIFYGQEDGSLARQLLVLAPGSYRLSMRLLGDPTQAKAVNWAVTCAGAQTPLASARLDVAAAHGLTLEVPANCPAQWIDLTGVSADLPRQADVTISGLRLNRGAAHG